MIIAIAVVGLSVASASGTTTLIPKGEQVVCLGVRPQSEVAESTAHSISELLLTELHRYTSVISDSDVEALLTNEAQRQAVAGCTEESCLAELGMALGAAFLISGTVGMVGDRAVLTVKLINTHEITTVTRASTAATSMGQLVGREARVIRELLGLESPGVNPLAIEAVGPPGAVGVTGMSVGGAALVAGVVLGFLANDKAAEVRSLGTPNAASLAGYNDARAEAETLALGADISWGVAVVGAALLIVDLFLLDNDEHLSAAIGTQADGLVLRF